MYERSLKAFNYHQDLARRAEYLTLGVLTASIAFFWQAHEPDVLGGNPSTMHLLGLLLLFISFGCSFSSIHWRPMVFGIQSYDLDLSAERSALVMNCSQSKLTVRGTSGVMDAQKQIERIKKIDKQREIYKSQIDQLNKKC